MVKVSATGGLFFDRLANKFVLKKFPISRNYHTHGSVRQPLVEQNKYFVPIFTIAGKCEARFGVIVAKLSCSEDEHSGYARIRL